MVSRFPEFSLEGKDSLKKRGNDENLPRRSTRSRGRRGEVKRIKEEEAEKERKVGSECREYGRDLLPRDCDCGAHWSTRGEAPATSLGRTLSHGAYWIEVKLGARGREK
ncbi:hypothetical protein ACOSQ2_009502 [Xanthoceras sorbifolium]